LTVHEPAEG